MAETSAEAPMVFDEKDMISVRNFAKRIGCSVRHAYNLVEKGPTAGGVLAFRYGVKRCYRIPKSEVGRFKKSRVVVEK